MYSITQSEITPSFLYVDLVTPWSRLLHSSEVNGDGPLIAITSIRLMPQNVAVNSATGFTCRTAFEEEKSACSWWSKPRYVKPAGWSARLGGTQMGLCATGIRSVMGRRHGNRIGALLLRYQRDRTEAVIIDSVFAYDNIAK